MTLKKDDYVYKLEFSAMPNPRRGWLVRVTKIDDGANSHRGQARIHSGIYVHNNHGTTIRDWHHPIGGKLHKDSPRFVHVYKDGRLEVIEN